MGGEKLWKILCKPVDNFRILVLFPSFNAYETFDEFETFCEKSVPSQPLLHIHVTIMKRSFLVSLPSTTFSILIPSCHLCYHIYVHRQSFTSIWKCSFFSLFLLMLVKRLRQLRFLVQRLLLIQSISKDCCIVGKRRNLFQKKRGRLNYQTAGYVLHQKKKRVHENVSKYNRKVASIILLLFSPTI